MAINRVPLTPHTDTESRDGGVPSTDVNALPLESDAISLRRRVVL
jgi:hypothetical protein